MQYQQDIEQVLAGICEDEDSFLNELSTDLLAIARNDAFIALGIIFETYQRALCDHLIQFVVPSNVPVSNGYVKVEITRQLCESYFERFVDICTRRIELCMLHFPNAVYGEASKVLIKQYLKDPRWQVDNHILNIPPIQRLSIPENDTAELREPPNGYSLSTLPAHTGLTITKDAAAQEESSKHSFEDNLDESDKAERYKDKRQARLEQRRIWNHLTISRDRTSASDFTRELLAKLFGFKVGLDNGGHHTDPGQALASAFDPHAEGYHRERSQIYRTNLTYQQQPNEQKQLGVDTQGNNWLKSRVTGLPMDRDLGLSDLVDDNEADNGKVDGTANKHSTNAAAVHNDHSSELTGMGSGIRSNDMLARITALEQENQALKKGKVNAFRCQRVYFLPAPKFGPAGPSVSNRNVQLGYLDEPRWAPGIGGGPVLKCNLPITDIEQYLRQRSDITFVVGYYYTPSTQEADVAEALLAKKDLPRPIPTSETITLHDNDMIAAVKEFLALQTRVSDDFPNLNIRDPIPAPYLFWYHYRSSNAIDLLGLEYRELMKFLTSWIEEHYASKYALADAQFSRRVVSQETMPFLVKPGDVLVWEHRREVHSAIAKDWLKQTSAPVSHNSNGEKEVDWSRAGKSTNKSSTTWSTDGWSFEYDGEFHRHKKSLQILLEFDGASEELPINKLSKYPLRFTSSQIRACLERRGRIFWKCRNKHLVSYNGEGIEQTTNGERFMVDYKTYEQLHTSSSLATTKFVNLNNDIDESERLSSEIMENDNPPPSPDIYVFPATIPGYNLHTKKWVDLKVDRIKEVEWNKESFKHLVVEPNTKELIQALVRHQISLEQGADIINRKGNGLIILLHGGPGTGKTFTAESVAELAEKPLFRVTCGDIGTKPEDVEKYLDSVLYLGKAWGCIVLIDEAEVFLEQRSLDNLERNALVSVFLRVLEYYEGILILTSNRVGTFDEAFKSRILLSLHYENLSEGQRTKIWKNMFRRLEDIGSGSTSHEDGVSAITEPGSRKRKARDDEPNTVGIDFDEVNCYITELAKHELNGRQIRNVITTARQLATFRNTPMRYEHLQHVISVSGKFDTYLKKLQEGFSDDQIARDEGFR